jgi:hypothetical protein
MASADRDDFLSQTILTLRKRAGEHCSRPECGCATAGPNGHPERALSIGVAAHIAAAALNGPRYDPNMSREARRSIDNAIWLCQNCAHIIDWDVSAHPVSLLKRWREMAEQRARDNVGMPLDKPLHESDAMEGWMCPHCLNTTPYGASVCLGCSADIVYGNTRREAVDLAKAGWGIGAGLGFLVMYWLPTWLNKCLDMQIPQGWGLGLYGLFAPALLAMLGGIFLPRPVAAWRRRSPPRFVRLVRT